MSLTESLHLKQHSYIHRAASSLSDSTWLVSRLLRRRRGNAGARGVCFGENRRLRPSCRGFHLGGHFDRLHWPEGARYVAGRAGTALESWLSVLEDLRVQRAGRFRGGGHHRRRFQRLQGVQDNIWRVLHAALPLQLPQLVQSRVHSSFDILQTQKRNRVSNRTQTHKYRDKSQPLRTTCLFSACKHQHSNQRAGHGPLGVKVKPTPDCTALHTEANNKQ